MGEKQNAQTPSATAPVTAHAAAIEHFTHRVPKFFMLPIDPVVFWRIALLALAVPLSFLLFKFGAVGVLALLAVGLLALVLGFRYGFRIIEQTARGFLRPSLFPPDFGERSISLRPYKYIAIYLLFGLIAGAVGFVFRGSEAMAVATWILLTALLLPAVTMRLTLTASLRAALRPVELFAVMRRIGQPYFTLCVFVFLADMCRTTGVLLVAGVGSVDLVALTNTQTNSSTTLLAVGMIGLAFWYFTYLISALIGYVMYEYAQVLNISVVGQGEQQRSGMLTRKVDMRKRTRDSIVDHLASSGDVRDAIELVNDDLSQRPNDLSLHARLHKLLLQEGSLPRIEAHTERYLDLLIASDNGREALPLAQEALDRNASWEPRRLEHVVPLARAALNAGKHNLVSRLIEGFDRKHRMHPDIPHLYLIAAQMLMQSPNPGAEDQVQALLNELITKHPKHPAGEEAARLLPRLSLLTVPAVMRPLAETANSH